MLVEGIKDKIESKNQPYKKSLKNIWIIKN